MRKVATGISTIFHPVFLPFMACYWLINQDVIFLRDDLKPLILQSIFIVGLAIPLISVFLLKQLGIVSSIRIPDVKERRIPYYITCSSYLLLGLFFRNSVYIPIELPIIFISCAISVFILIYLIPITKASAHMACIGGITGALYVFTVYLSYPLFIPIIITFLISGIVGWSRLELKAHTPEQLLIGFIIGFTTQFLGFVFYNKINTVIDFMTP